MTILCHFAFFLKLHSLLNLVTMEKNSQNIHRISNTKVQVNEDRTLDSRVLHFQKSPLKNPA